MHNERRNRHDFTMSPGADLRYAWILQPFLFLCAVHLACQFPSRVLEILPDVAPWSQGTNLSVVQRIPTSLPVVWRLGQLSKDTTAESLAEASRLAGWNFSTHEELTAIGDLLRDYETTHRSLPARIWGFMTFINIVWTLSIIGMVVTFFPFLQFFSPLAKFLARMFTGLYELVLRPLHEPLGYVLCYLVTCQGMRYAEDTGVYVSLAGTVGFLGMLTYSTEKHRDLTPTPTVKRFLFHVTIVGVSAPLAIHFQSRLLGYLTVIALHTAMGFGVSYSGLCYVVGFDDKSSLQKSVLTSLVTIPLLLLLRGNTVPGLDHYLAPFSHAVHVSSTIVYLLALLILSSRYYWSPSERRGYFPSQIIMIVSLVAFLLYGTVHGVESFVNIASTFAVLYLMEKVEEMPLWQDAGIVLVFLSFVAMFVGSLFLHTHPGFLVSLFTVGG